MEKLKNLPLEECVSAIAENFITENWDGGIGIPLEFPEMTIEEKVSTIYAARENGPEIFPCAYLEVEFGEAEWLPSTGKKVIKRMVWYSGSRQGAMEVKNNVTPATIKMVDTGTFASEYMEKIMEFCRDFFPEINVVLVKFRLEQHGLHFRGPDSSEILKSIR